MVHTCDEFKQYVYAYNPAVLVYIGHRSPM